MRRGMARQRRPSAFFNRSTTLPVTKQRLIGNRGNCRSPVRCDRSYSTWGRNGDRVWRAVAATGLVAQACSKADGRGLRPSRQPERKLKSSVRRARNATVLPGRMRRAGRPVFRDGSESKYPLTAKEAADLRPQRGDDAATRASRTRPDLGPKFSRNTFRGDH